MGKGIRQTVTALAAACAIALVGAASAHAQGPVEVLVFHGPPDATTDAGVAAVRAGGFEVDATADPAQISTANLAGYRAVVFLNTAGEHLDDTQEAALEDYVTGGGGFVGIGSTAQGEPDSEFFTTLIGARPSGSSSTATSEQAVVAGDRVHPATRDLPLVWNRTDVWYQWNPRPTGRVHTVIRYRAPNSGAGDGISSHSPDQPISWCTDVSDGRSFYMGMGRTAEAFGEERLRAHLKGAIQWSAGLIRGNCKAGIDANYSATRIVQAGPTSNGTLYSGESHGLVTAPNGWVLYIGRGDCRTDAERGALVGQASLPRILDHANPNVGLGCGTVHVWDPEAYDGTVNSGVTRAGTLAVYGDGGDVGRAHQRGQPQARVGSARHRAVAGLHADRPRLPAVLPELQPKLQAAWARRGSADLQDLAPAHLALHAQPQHEAAQPRLRGAHLRVRRPGLLLLPRRRRHGLRLRRQPLRDDR